MIPPTDIACAGFSGAWIVYGGAYIRECENHWQRRVPIISSRSLTGGRDEVAKVAGMLAQAFFSTLNMIRITRMYKARPTTAVATQSAL